MHRIVFGIWRDLADVDIVKIEFHMLLDFALISVSVHRLDSGFWKPIRRMQDCIGMKVIVLRDIERIVGHGHVRIQIP